MCVWWYNDTMIHLIYYLLLYTHFISISYAQCNNVSRWKLETGNTHFHFKEWRKQQPKNWNKINWLNLFKSVEFERKIIKGS